MRFIGRLLWLFITVITVASAMAFATSNEARVAVSLWPIDYMITAPLWLVTLGALGIGIVIGGVVVWVSFLTIRARNWRLRQNLDKMERRAIAAEEKLQRYDEAPGLSAPSLPSHNQ